MHRILFLVALASGCVHVSEERSSLTPDEPFDRVRIVADGGDVDIGTDALESGDTLEVYRRWRGENEPRIDGRVEDGALVVEADCPDLCVGLCICSVDLLLDVPEGLPVEVSTGSGDVWVDDMGPVSVEAGSGDVFVSDSGDVVASTGSGDVEAGNLTGGVTVEAGSGDVHVWDVPGDVDVRTGSGDVTMDNVGGSEIFARTNSGDVDVNGASGFESLEASAGSGDLLLSVDGTSFRLDLTTGSGDVELDRVMNDSSAEATITGHTGSGDIRVFGG